MSHETNEITSLATLMAVYVERQHHVDEKLDELKEVIADIRDALIGDAGNGRRPGLIIRIDRAEQRLANRDKLIWVIIPVIIGLIVTRFMEGL